jgi:Pectinacetylesterase
LKNRKGIARGELRDATRVLLSGTSAGGAGVMMHLDWLAERLPNGTVRGVNDAGWIPESGVISDVLPLDRLIKEGIGFWNGTGDASCYVANLGSKNRCYLSGVYPYIQTPMMIQMSQHDRWVLGLFGIKEPFNFIEQGVADLFADAVRKSLAPVNAAFSPRTVSHGVLPYTRFNSLQISGISFQQILGTWFFDRPGTVKVIKN